MGKFLSRLFPRLKEHLTDDCLASLRCDELTWTAKLIVKQHLANCQLCQVRKDRFEDRLDDVMASYRRGLKRKNPSVPPDDTAEFLKRLDQLLTSYVPQKKQSFRWPRISFPELPSMNPALATCLALTFAATVSFFVWLNQRTPNITSNRLLVRAERWDAAEFQGTPGVVYQAVKITVGKHTIQHKIYRDTQGKRQPKAVKLTAVDVQLKDNIAAAGIDWDEPLSASNYQRWHDSQHVREDEITREGRHLLTLTTETQEGPVKTQSLTVRDTDFHPVRRTVAFRDNSTVEIAEVEFKLLPWAAVDASIFEPASPMETAAMDIPARVIPFRLPSAPTPQQLDEAELSVRLVLNQLHADTGEQIQVNRNAQQVEVSGVVDTEERKQQIQMQLRSIPHVAAAIKSVADLDNASGAGQEISAVKTVPTSTEPSPLETYLVARGRSLPSITELAQKLNGSALTINQESRAIGNLQGGFTSSQHRSLIASATLTELIFSHRQRLQAALREEHDLLALVLDAGAKAAVSHKDPLPQMADRNLALCSELTTSSKPGSRNAPAILAELTASLELLTAESRDIDFSSQGGPALSEKR